MPVIVRFSGASGSIYRLVTHRSPGSLPESPGIYTVMIPPKRRKAPYEVVGVGEADWSLRHSLHHDPDFIELQAYGGRRFGYLVVKGDFARLRVMHDLVLGLSEIAEMA